jgi:hypothetical protein
MKGIAIFVMLTCAIFTIFLLSNRRYQSGNVMQKGIGKDISDFFLYSYPTDNYGVGTSCAGAWMPEGMILCDMKQTYGLNLVTTDQEAWKTVNGYAYVGVGGEVVLDDSLTAEYATNVLLPNIMNKLNICATANEINHVHLRITGAMIRYLNYGAFKHYVMSGANPALLTAWNNKSLLVATADIVLTSYTLEIYPQENYRASLRATFNAAINNMSTSQDSMGIGISVQKNGQLLLRSNKHVVLGVYISRQTKTGVWGKEDDFTGWEHAGYTQYLF